MRGFSGKKTKYVLPIEYSYGPNSVSKYEKIKNEVAGISLIPFFDIYEDTVFYVSDVRLRVAKINLKSDKIEFFGQEPENFHPVALNKKTSEALLKDPQVLEEITTKHSFIAGIFADKEFVGVIYVNREKKVGNSLYYVPYLQIYDHSGKVKHEQPLVSFYSEERIIPLYYQKDTRLLYLCSIIHGQESTKYVIYKYQIKP